MAAVAWKSWCRWLPLEEAVAGCRVEELVMSVEVATPLDAVGCSKAGAGAFCCRSPRIETCRELAAVGCSEIGCSVP